MSANSLGSFDIPELKVDEKILQSVMDAFAKGEITITPANKYRGKWPRHGYTWYLIRWGNIVNKRINIVYNGAYEMRKIAEEKLKQKEMLTQFLIFQLALEVQFKFERVTSKKEV